MKSLFTLSLIFILNFSFGQSFVSGYFGTGLSNVHFASAKSTGYAKMNFQIGGEYSILLNEKWYVGAGIELSHSGYQHPKVYYTLVSYHSRYGANNINLPVTLGYQFGYSWKFMPFVKVNSGLNLTSMNRIWFNNPPEPELDNLKKETRSYQLSASIGIEVSKTFNQFEAFSRISYRQGINTIFDPGTQHDDLRFISGRLSIGVRYSFIPVDKN